ncbi:MAG: hypothetical protein QF648_02875 [Candidatus Marinimicrobia bacterium]|nr:hypothetical protein [Candidatus Neomarinimicrobiota bacterium]
MPSRSRKSPGVSLNEKLRIGIHSVIKNGQVVDLEALPVAPIISSMKVPDMKTDNETR